MLTAMEARELAGAGPTPEERVEIVTAAIREAAMAKKRKLALEDTFWVRDAYENTADYQKACDILKGLGYKVSFFYEERQFVDMYTIVEW